MAIATLAAYREELSKQRQILPIVVGSSTVVQSRPIDLWTLQLPVGVAPTASVVPTNTTAGSLGQLNPSSGQLSIIGAQFKALNHGNYIIADRLVHTGGLSGVVTTAQTTNLPTTALTRYTSGEGVMIGLTIYSQVGATGTTVSATYTNQAGTGSRVTPLVVFGGTAYREAARLIVLPLQAGDTGVRSVESVTVTATTATAGNFGVTLFKPLYTICVDDASGVGSDLGFITGNTAGGIATIQNDACLFTIAISGAINAAAAGHLLVSEN